MDRSASSMTVIAAIAASTFALAACQRGGGTTGRAAGTIAARGARATVVDSAAGDVAKDSAAAAPGEKWITDANAVSLLASMNARQIAAADIELKTWHLDTVRAFAAAVARQHADLQHSADSLAAAIHLTPVAPALAQSIDGAMQAQIDSMTSNKGSALDRAFVREQIASQQMMLDNVQRLSSVAERPEVQTLMATAASRLEDQLGRARALQKTFAVTDSVAAVAAADSAAMRSRRHGR